VSIVPEVVNAAGSSDDAVNDRGAADTRTLVVPVLDACVMVVSGV